MYVDTLWSWSTLATRGELKLAKREGWGVREGGCRGGWGW